MQALFAPWRMEYLENHDPKKGCILCHLHSSKEGSEKDRQVLFRGKHCYVVINKFPYSNGHLMVLPYRHEGEWQGLKQDELLELNQLSQDAIRVLDGVYQPQGFNIGVNIGRAAGQGVEGHVHQHIVPRWTGDVNFMPLFSETKVISEHLSQTYDRLLDGWKKLKK